MNTQDCKYCADSWAYILAGPILEQWLSCMTWQNLRSWHTETELLASPWTLMYNATSSPLDTWVDVRVCLVPTISCHVMRWSIQMRYWHWFIGSQVLTLIDHACKANKRVTFMYHLWCRYFRCQADTLPLTPCTSWRLLCAVLPTRTKQRLDAAQLKPFWWHCK